LYRQEAIEKRKDSGATALIYSLLRCHISRHVRNTGISYDGLDGGKSIPGRTPSLSLNTSATTGCPSGRESPTRGDREVNLSPAFAHVNRLHRSTALLRRAVLAASASDRPSPTPELIADL